MCKKTKMCRFFARASCNRGENCHFAHDMAELVPMPDLNCTKLCSILNATGSCTDPKCAFAHNKRELRILAKLLTPAKSNGSTLRLTAPTQASPLSVQVQGCEHNVEDEVGQACAPRPHFRWESVHAELSVRVKNTFITVESATECHLLRSKSAPPGLVQLGNADRLVLRGFVESPWGTVRHSSPAPRARKQSNTTLNLMRPFA